MWAVLCSIPATRSNRVESALKFQVVFVDPCLMLNKAWDSMFNKHTCVTSVHEVLDDNYTQIMDVQVMTSYFLQMLQSRAVLASRLV